MFDDGYHNNISIDICENVIEFMKERNASRKGCIFKKMDVREMTFPDETFDLVIDKCTIDSLISGDHGSINTAKMTKEISRVLKTGGIYFVISYGTPDNRMPHLERSHLGFDIQIYTIKKEEEEGQMSSKMNYCYVCTKTEEAKENIFNIDLVINNLEREELEEEEEDEEDDK